MSFKVLLSSLLLVAAATASAAARAPATSLQDQLNYIMIAAPTKGTRSDFQQYTNYFLSKGTSFDTTQERDVAYFSVVGVEAVNQKFDPRVLSTVSESWKKGENKSWVITQKIREINLSGQIYKSLAKVIVLDSQGFLTSSENLPAPNAADDQAAFAQEVATWYLELKD